MAMLFVGAWGLEHRDRFAPENPAEAPAAAAQAQQMSDCHDFRVVFVFTMSAPAIQVLIPTMGAFEHRQLIVDFGYGHFGSWRLECNGNDDSA